MVISDSLRHRIKSLAEKQHLGPTELEEKSGVPRGTISKILNDSPSKKDINTETLEKLAKGLGCTVKLLKKGL